MPFAVGFKAGEAGRDGVKCLCVSGANAPVFDLSPVGSRDGLPVFGDNGSNIHDYGV